MSAPQMRSLAPRANAENRAEDIRYNAFVSAACPEREGTFATIFARRCFPFALAALVARLAELGGESS